MRVIEVLNAAGRIRDVYMAHEHKTSNIEYSSFDDGNVTIYSVKGTDKNIGKRRWFSLIRDVVSDIRFMPRYHTEMGVYQPGGFRDAGIDLANDICANHVKTDLIDLEGHSLGGAASLIAADILIRRGYQIRKVIVLGAPKTGRLKFIHLTDVISVRAGRDVVPTIPPMYWFLSLVDLGEHGGRLKDHSLVESYIKKLLKMDPEEHL